MISDYFPFFFGHLYWPSLLFMLKSYIRLESFLWRYYSCQRRRVLREDLILTKAFSRSFFVNDNFYGAQNILIRNYWWYNPKKYFIQSHESNMFLGFTQIKIFLQFMKIFSFIGCGFSSSYFLEFTSQVRRLPMSESDQRGVAGPLQRMQWHAQLETHKALLAIDSFIEAQTT